MEDSGSDVLLYQIAQGLPFYSQVLCSIHRNKENAAKPQPEGRTLFLRSLDPVLSKDSIANGLSIAGDVELIPLGKEDDAGASVSFNKGQYHAVLKDENMLKKIIGGKGRILHTVVQAKSHIQRGGETFLQSVLQKRRLKYRGMDILQKNADECLMQHDIENDIQRRLDREVVVDEEGFTLVTNGPDIVKGDRRVRTKRKRDTTTTINFYRFPNKQAVMEAMEKENHHSEDD